MSSQSNYKRTMAGSVGAGMGAIFNGSGRTYYILEHKTQSKYHNVGEAQKIIIDQVELGRDSSCQVRFDESFETVSRKHAAIVRDGDNWELVHLSTSNPTLVNGQPIQGHYYLQSGDEIQLSAGGPRMGFIVPQGKQGLTSSIRLTERMNLFRKQALAPYRTALWILGCLLVAAIVASAVMFCQGKKIIDEQQVQLEQYQVQLDSLNAAEAKLMEQLANTPDNEELQKQLEEVKAQKRSVVTYINKIVPVPAPKPTPDEEEIDEIDDEEDDIVIDDNDGSSDDIVNYYEDIYTLKVDRITIEWGGKSIVPEDIVKTDVIVGTAFTLPGGKLVTSRSNLEPWIYGTGSWCDKLAWCQSIGANIVIDYLAYSTRGTGHPLRFKNTDFNLTALHAHDKTEVLEITREVKKTWEFYGIELSRRETRSQTYYRTKLTAESYSAGVLQMGAPGGLPTDNAVAQSLKGGEEVVIAGFNGNPNIHDLTTSIKYHSSHTSRTAEFRLITLQDTYSNAGYTGSPVFFKGSDGSYRVVGVNVGNHNGETYVARITDLKQ